MAVIKRIVKAIATETYMTVGLVAAVVTWIAWRSQ